MQLHYNIEKKGNRKGVCFVGDLHLSHSTPMSRIDDFSITSLKKLNSIFETIDGDVVDVIFTGDIFHNNRQPFSYVYEVMKILHKWRARGYNLYTIVGNHDLIYNKLENITKSPLGLLIANNLLIPFSTIEIDSSYFLVKIYGYHFPEPLKPAEKDEDRITFCVAHKFYEFTLKPKESLHKEDIKGLDYNFIVLGHDHVPYENKFIDGTEIVRSGSILRGTSHGYNLERDVYIDICFFRDEMVWERRKLDVPPADEVFSSLAFRKSVKKTRSNKKEEVFIPQLTENVDELIEKIDEGVDEQLSVYDILDTMEIETPVKNRTIHYLEDIGIFRKELK